MIPLRSWLGLAGLVILLSGCQTHRYNNVVKPILESGFVDPRAEAISLQMLDSKSGKPAGGVTVFILSTNQPMQLISDSNGWIQLPILEAWRRENPRLTNDYPKRLTVRATFTATIGPTNP